MEKNDISMHDIRHINLSIRQTILVTVFILLLVLDLQFGNSGHTFVLDPQASTSNEETILQYFVKF